MVRATPQRSLPSLLGPERLGKTKPSETVSSQRQFRGNSDAGSPRQPHHFGFDLGVCDGLGTVVPSFGKLNLAKPVVKPTESGVKNGSKGICCPTNSKLNLAKPTLKPT